MSNLCIQRSGQRGKVKYKTRAQAVKFSRRNKFGVALYAYKCPLGCGYFHLSHEKPNFVTEHVPSISKLRRKLKSSAQLISKQARQLAEIEQKYRAQEQERAEELRCIEIMFNKQHRGN